MTRRPSVLRLLFLTVLTLALVSLVSADPAPKKNKKKKKDEVNALAAQSYMRQAYVFMQQQKYEEALDRFREADQASPGNATVFNMMGLCHLSLEQFDQALANFDKALQLIPGFTDARNNRGSTYLSLEQYRLAEVDFIAVLSDSTYPHRWKVFYNLGLTYLARGQIGAAEENFRKAITAPVPVFEAYLRLAEIAHAQGRTDSALGLMEEARFKYPERLDGTLYYGRLLIEAGRPRDARPYLEDVINSVPGSALADEARELLGQT
jgi:Tfp pilus assembly protein PilF